MQSHVQKNCTLTVPCFVKTTGVFLNFGHRRQRAKRRRLFLAGVGTTLLAASLQSLHCDVPNKVAKLGAK